MNAEPSKGNDDEVTVQTEATREDEQPVVAEDGSAGPPADGELQEPDVQSRAEPDLAESAGVVETPEAATQGLTQGEERVEVAGDAEGQVQGQVEGSGEGNGDGNGAAVDYAISENGEAVALAESASPPLSTVMATPAAVQKKFTSLNVNRRFLEKASPTLPAATVPTATNASTPHSSSRLSTITPASRLTSAKLSKAVKLQPAGWGQLASAASPGTLSPSADPLASAASAISTSDAASTPPTAKQPIVASAPVAASPKLVTALTSGSVNRSTSPQNKGSPGLRNAALAASGRSSTPSVVTPTISSSTKAPWAKVKTDAVPKQSALSSDFPTAAEAAKAKQEAERREKAAAAEAAAKAEQALQHLERYRGTSLGAGNHWDEMDDEDDLDEVVQFGDGTQYKVPVKKEDEPVSKEERFKDVGHDRSWPPKAAEMPAAAPTTASSGRLMPGVRPSSIRDPVPETGPPSRLVNPRANKVEIRSGEGISLESEAPLDRGYGQREARPFFRRDREGEEGQGARPVAAAAPSVAPARTWGPLAQRQATLNPDAPKPAELSSPSANKAPVPSQPVQQVQPVKVSPLSQHTPSSGESGPLSPAHQSRPAPPAAAPPLARSTGSERALPPHLAANFVPPLKAGPSPRSDREVTEPRAAVQATPYESKASVPSAATTILSPTPSAEAVAAPQRMTARGDVQREEMLSAAERARKRRQEEEDRRQAEKERAKAKAAAIEEKIRLAKEEEEEKKRAEAAEKKKIEEDEKRKHEEALARRETEQRSSRGNRPELTSAHLNAANERGGQQRAATMLLSPSDEAVSWRRSRPAAPLVPPGIPASETDGGRHAFKDVRPETADNGRPPLTLLQRSAPLAKASRGPVASHNEQDLASSTGMEGWDVVINRIKDSAPPASPDVQIPTGPRAAKATGAVMDAQGRGKQSIKAPRVEIIAPTDEGAAKQRVAEQRQREARQTQGPPVSVLKSGSASIRTPAAATEGPETRSEVAFDSPPVWNRYKIKVGLSNAPARLPRHIAKAQAMRVASFKNESTTPRPITILTWEPPIGNLSSRTLSRDDLFFPKKYRKGVVITNVSVPTAKLERRPRTESTSISPVVRVPASRRETTREAQWRTHGDSSSPSLAIPKAPASMRAKGSTVAVPNSTVAGLPGRQEASTGDSARVVSFARSVTPRDDEAPSPVSFMVTSELTSKEVPHVSLPLSAHGLAAKATPRNTLPSPNQMTSTWGENTLTFAGLDSSESGAATADRDHIKNVWATPSGDNGNELAPKQNSLRGIVDDFPSTMALSMQDLKDGDSSVTPAAQYHDVGINTTKAEMHNSANSSRIYLPMASHDKMADGRNGFASMTSASSPSTARSKARDKTTAVNGSSMSIGKPASRSPSLGMATSFHQEHRQDFSHAQQYSHQHQRGGQARTSSTGFSPYAYPSPIQDYTISDVPGGFVNGQQQRSFAGTHHYAPDDRYGAASGVNAYGPYRGNPISPNMAGMSASAAGWPIDNPSAGYYGNPPSMQQQQQAPWNMMMTTPQPHHTPHHLRISSSASRLQASTPGGGPMRGAASSHSHRTNPAGGTKPTGSSGVNSGGNSNANHANDTDTSQREEGQGASSGGGAAGSPSSMRYRAVW